MKPGNRQKYCKVLHPAGITLEDKIASKTRSSLQQGRLFLM
ncbi:hypothetical protein FTV88_3053 [Heliorestis convoluta]|uniref:Uncharacterized protein n=1 Tax=Heliorestis convoluta TaxID=356322 RepID=A0A5Q2N2A0_9FIRM|nr:hypothetical protein FTV88_3053 [Heliorestis convoluta]